MKNIHVIPTGKPSRLQINTCFDNILELWDEIDTPKIKQDGCIQYYNIYITPEEDIKVGDWVVEFQRGDTIGEVHFINSEYVIARDIQKKITLTTNPDLIKNGVQAINDEFLNWFVKNPKCDDIEVVDWYNKFLSCCRSKEECHCNKKRIIIPTEEPKQDYKKLSEGFTEILNSIPDDVFLKYAEPKQETLEEAAKEFVLSHDFSKLTNPNHLANRCFQFGAEWQKEKYTIEEQHIERSLGELEKAYIKGFNEGAEWKAKGMHSEAIEFAEWIRIKDFQTASKDNWIGLDMKCYTSEELFNQFKKQFHHLNL